MASSAPLLSASAWKERLAPAFTRSMRAVHEKITSQRSVQQWLQQASFQAAQNLTAANHFQAEAQAHARLLADLADTFPALVEAVHELTDGCGQLDLHWRPLNPNYSRVEVRFGRDFEIDVFYRCEAMDEANLQAALRCVKSVLPDSEPFPGRPQTATGLVAYAGRVAGFRWVRRLNDKRKTWVTGTVLPPNADAIENIRPSSALQVLRQVLVPAAN